MMPRESLRISLVQYDIAWENIKANLDNISAQFQNLAGNTDLVILPEMFSTGFSMKPELFAEEMGGETIRQLKTWAMQFGFAIAGSLIISENGQFFNRAVFVTPESEVTVYDKRHLFRMGEEPRHYTGGTARPIINYRGWNICLLICYDLRFPVWSRNRHNEYDLLIYVANWPSVRAKVWDVLLKARAIENMAYVCGVNRVGVDGLNLQYDGGSVVLNPRADEILNLQTYSVAKTVEISYTELTKLRAKFPTWKDADEFNIIL